MPTLSAHDPSRTRFSTARRATAIANANWFRALAWRALRDGAPNGALRAVNARRAAHIVLRHARRDAVIDRMVRDALTVDP